MSLRKSGKRSKGTAADKTGLHFRDTPSPSPSTASNQFRLPRPPLLRIESLPCDSENISGIHIRRMEGGARAKRKAKSNDLLSKTRDPPPGAPLARPHSHVTPSAAAVGATAVGSRRAFPPRTPSPRSTYCQTQLSADHPYQGALVDRSGSRGALDAAGKGVNVV